MFAHLVRRRVVKALAFAAAALAFAVVALVGPANVDRATFNWSAADDSLDIPLVLSAARPESIKVGVPCELAGSSGGSGPRQLFTTSTAGRGLTLVGQGRDLLVRVGNADVVSLPIPAAASCDAEVHFDLDGGLLRLRVGSATAEALLERDAQPIVTGLHADPDTAGSALSARIVTQPTGSSPSGRQLAAIAGGVVCVFVATVLLLRGSRTLLVSSGAGRARATAAKSWLATPSLVASDGVVAAAALASAVLTPATFDDGWILAIVRGFGDTGRVSTYYERDDALAFLGGWWDALLYPFLSATSNVVVLRLLFVGLAVVAWWVVRRWIIDQWSTGAARRHARWAAAAMAVLLLPAWMTTLRPEPLVALLAVVCMAATIRFCQHPSIASLLTLLAAAALAMTSHPTGWAVAAAAAPALLFLVPWLREAPRFERLLALAAAVLIPATVAILLIGFDADLRLLRQAAVDFTTSTATPTHSFGPQDEWIRPYRTIVLHSAVRRAAMLVPLLGFLAAVAARPRSTELNAQRLALWCSAAGYLGLSLTSSKWPWHYGAVMPFSIVLVAVGFQRLLADESSWPALKRGMAAVCVALVGAWALATEAPWNELDLSTDTWAELRHSKLLGGLDVSRPIVWLVGLFVAAGVLLGVRILKRRPVDVTGGALALALGAACLVPVGLTWSLLVDDARSSDGWSFTSQLLSSAMGRDVCGLPDDLPVVASAAPLARASNPDDLPGAFPDAYDHVRTNARLPAAGVDTWGTGTAPAGRRNLAWATGRFSTPWYALEGRTDLAFWTVGRTGDPNRILVESRAADDAVTSNPIERATDALYWSFNRVPQLPTDAVEMRLVFEDNDIGPGGWLAATAPAAVSYRPFAATVSAHDRVFIAPEFHLYAPCVELPSLRGGYLHPFAASLMKPPNRAIAQRMMSEGSVVETGCAVTGACAYRLTAADAASLLSR
jgi:hypothetical protein